MKGMAKLTLIAELDGTQFRTVRARTVDDLRSMLDMSVAYEWDTQDMAGELRDHWQLLIQRSKATP